MDDWVNILNDFLTQAQGTDLKTSTYPKEFNDLRMRVSFGMGMPAKIPWIALIAPDMAVSKGYYPVYLYYKDLNTLILSYGISETEEFGSSWPVDIMNSSQTIKAFFDHDVPRYGDSFVFKAYMIEVQNDKVLYYDYETRNSLTSADVVSDMDTITDYYKRTFSNLTTATIDSHISQGLFYMEKQLEDFIIQNWDNTELGKKYDLLIEEGELVSQQYRTDIGPIDILAKDKKNGNFVVIELKKNQTSDDTVGQLTRYMGWIKKIRSDKNVAGIIIAGQNDKRLEYALSMVPNTELFLYEVDFKLNKVS